GHGPGSPSRKEAHIGAQIDRRLRHLKPRSLDRGKLPKTDDGRNPRKIRAIQRGERLRRSRHWRNGLLWRLWELSHCRDKRRPRSRRTLSGERFVVSVRRGRIAFYAVRA